MQHITVSVVMPVYNEEKHIDRCLRSLLMQTYPLERTEWLLVDGGSTDGTVERIRQYANKVNVRLLHNEKRLVTYALNIGIGEAVGDYIIRMDAHAEYAADYIERCVDCLMRVDADNVGGLAETVGEGYIGSANAELLSSKFGVGNSGFRTNAESGYTDTVPFGAFRREIFERVGLFDPELPRSEDNDFNSRIRASGGKVYLSTDIHFIYYCRSTVRGLLDQGIKNGNALFLTLRKNPSAMSLRHYVPFLFVLSLIALPLLSLWAPIFGWMLLAEVLLYLSLDMYFSLFKGSREYFFYKFLMYPLFHICYGIGSLLGAFGIKLY